LNRVVSFRWAALLGALLCLLSPSRAAAADTLVVMPFENRSQMGDYNWIRESFAILLADTLDAPGLSVLSTDERNQAFDKLRLSPNDLLTRAAMIRIANASQSNLALIGEFDIGGEKENTTIAVTARLIETREARLVGNKVFNFSGPLAELQQMQGQLAWNILYERNPSLPYSKDQLIRKASNSPPKAYESYIKAVQTSDLKLRESFLRRAIQEFERSDAAGHYSQALYEIGLLLYKQNNFPEAVKNFKELKPEEPFYEESLFFLGLAANKSNDNAEAIASFEKLIAAAPMLEALNNAGVIAMLRGEKEKGLQYLQRAMANGPNDPVYRFNYGYGLWRSQNYPEAINHLRAAVKANPKDGEAYFILARALSSTGKDAEAAEADNEAKRRLESYAKWAVALDKIPSLFRIKQDFNRAAFYNLERKKQIGGSVSIQQINLRQRLDRARQLIAAKDDVEAFKELQAALAIDATNAEAFFLRAVVMQRNNQTEGALAALQSAVSSNPRMIEAHIALGRIYLSRGDRAQAVAHSRQAIEIDPQNRDAIALKQQIEIGR
jgi:tetratricopeptide (TPR) repeat protein